MAECIRVPFLLLVALNVCLVRGDSKAFGEDLMNPQAGGGGGGPEAPAPGRAGAPADKSPAAGASAPRRRSAAPWKLSEEAACRDDLTRLCPKHSWTNNLAGLECLQDRKEVTSSRSSGRETVN
ncbi:hypothetical protein NHX12_034254 [Muraenolepis orangiensis]|uniref:Uncharacterized protein n=1 Tax=Muraenolepis orangiensis TaxID=630683 RepID=A0A9Q0D2X8_9TELE|nr:hypothetical protein NHX12_034254 [Muraenolepis orangiensis]